VKSCEAAFDAGSIDRTGSRQREHSQGTLANARKIAQAYAGNMGLKIISLGDTWARRAFVICCRNDASLPTAARLLVDYLRGRARHRTLR
jgi:hypothetical protein